MQEAVIRIDRATLTSALEQYLNEVVFLDYYNVSDLQIDYDQETENGAFLNVFVKRTENEGEDA